jgi:hypothetical protein
VGGKFIVATVRSVLQQLIGGSQLGIIHNLGANGAARRLTSKRKSARISSPVAGVHCDVPLAVGMDGIFEARQHKRHISCIAQLRNLLLLFRGVFKRILTA